MRDTIFRLLFYCYSLMTDRDKAGDLFKRILNLLTLFLLLIVCKSATATKDIYSGYKNDLSFPPEINIHSVISPPGELLLQVDALNFEGVNGQISAITLRIDIDTMLITFMSIQNYVIPGTWMANYNQALHEITVVYTASSGLGYDLNGKLLDLQIYYQGGFPANLTFKPNCEVSNKSLMTIENIIYGNGSIEQSPPVGSVTAGSTAAHLGQVFPIPIMIGGEGFIAVSSIKFLISFDSTKMSYQGYQLLALSGLEVEIQKNQISIFWTDTLNPANFVNPVNLLNLQFVWLGLGNTEIKFKPGSKVNSLSSILPTHFINGLVSELYQVITSASPTQGGITTGDGYFAEDAPVSVSATSNQNYSFAYWSVGNTIVSYDTLYEFSMPANNIIVTADFIAATYLLTLVVEPGGSGSVTGGGIYSPGQLVSVSATPNLGYSFVNWTLNNAVVSTQPTFQFSMPAGNVTLIANFELTTYELTLLASPPGGGTVIGAGNYVAGEIVTVSAIANQGYNFVNWTINGNVVSWQPEYIFTMPAGNVVLTANFQLTAYELILESSPAGAGFLTGNGLYNAGEQIMVNAVALPDYEFVNWTLDGNVISNLPGFIYVMPANNVTLVANFIITGYQLTLLVEPSGSGQVSGGGIYNQAEEVTISAFAESGYSFINWTQDGMIVSTQAVFNYSMPGNDVTLLANFELSGYELSLEVSPAGSGQVTGAGLFNAGEIATITAIANSGFGFINWTLDGTIISTLQTLEYLMPPNDVTLIANFEYLGYQLNVEANPSGAAQVMGSGTYDAGDLVAVSAIENPGYFFLNWTKDGMIISNQPSFIYLMPANNVLLKANFVPVEYKITLQVEPDNAGTVSGEGFYSAGETVEIHAEPVSQNHFLNWSLNGTVVSLQPDYSFTMPANDISFTANFSVKMFEITAIPNHSVYGTVSGEGAYPRGSLVILNASAAINYRFILWMENDEIVSHENPLSFIVDTNRTLTAYFQKDEPCIAPIALYVSEIGKTSALLHWLPAGGENSWRVLWGLRNFDTINGGTLIGDVTSNGYFLEHLNPDTAYDFFIKAVCNTAQSSRWEGPGRFSTMPVGVHSEEAEHEIKVFPNPSNDFLFIKFAGETKKAISLEVVDCKGTVVISQKGPIYDNYCLTLEGVKPGVYVLRLVMDNKVVNVSFVVY